MSRWLLLDNRVSVVVAVAFLILGILRFCKSVAATAQYRRTFKNYGLVHSELATYGVGLDAPIINRKRKIAAILAALAAVVFVYLFTIDNYSFLWMAGVSIYYSLSLISRQRLPAAILVLGRSIRHVQELQIEMNRSLPFRAISLIVADNALDMVRLADDNFRVGSGTDWRKTVEYLCDILPLLVLDLRSTSPYVEKELDLVLAHFVGKTVFVGNDQRRREMQVRTDMNAIVFVLDDAECIAMLNRIVTAKQKIADPWSTYIWADWPKEHHAIRAQEL
jgi:hypothetical protein